MAETLNLCDDFERPTVVFWDGSECEMRTMDELSIGDLKALNKVNVKNFKLEDMQKILQKILIDPTKEQLDSLPVGHARKIFDFFSERVGSDKPTNGSTQSPDSNDSTVAQSASG